MSDDPNQITTMTTVQIVSLKKTLRVAKLFRALVHPASACARKTSNEASSEYGSCAVTHSPHALCTDHCPPSGRGSGPTWACSCTNINMHTAPSVPQRERKALAQVDCEHASVTDTFCTVHNVRNAVGGNVGTTNETRQVVEVRAVDADHAFVKTQGQFKKRYFFLHQ